MGTVSLPITSRTSAHDRAFDDVYANDLAIITEVNGGLDAANLADDAVDTDQLANGSVTTAKLSGVSGDDNANYAAVLTEQSVSSTSFTDLATAGPSVTVTVPANGLVEIFAQVDGQSSADDEGQVGIYEATDISTATKIMEFTLSSFTTKRITLAGDGGTTTSTAASSIVIPATAGSRTYTLKYKRTDSGESPARFKNRKLWVTVYNPN